MDLPSKKIVVASLFGIAILGVSLWSTNKDNLNLSYQKENPAEKLALVEDFTLLDSDHDGLKDWEEILWKTDPYNPDTDGDGVSDSEEINQKRNPLISGPGNKEENDKIFKDRKLSTTIKNKETLTDITTQKLLFEYFDKKGRGPLSPAASASLGKSFSYITNTKILDFYKLSDIKTSAGGVENIKKYGNEMGKVIKGNHHLINSFALLVLYEAVATKDKDKIKNLDQFNTAYGNITKQGLKISVPKELAKIHLALINDFNNLNTAISNMKTFFKDPLLGALGVSQYQKVSEKMLIDFNNIKDFFIKNNIYFDQNESGDLFRQTLETMK